MTPQSRIEGGVALTGVKAAVIERRPGKAASAGFWLPASRLAGSLNVASAKRQTVAQREEADLDGTIVAVAR
jgi:hypothetical protein